jgi:uncharacterized membrane protein YraQ (UPF0718 family)
MMSPGILVIFFVAILLATIAWSRQDESLGLGFTRAIEQFVKMLPRMICALIGAGFMVKLIPTEIIGNYLGVEAGFTGVLIGSVSGLIVPAGGMIAFAIAAALANEGASVPALISFVTCWALFAAHRLVIFELPMLGASFARLRMLSVLVLPFLAGTIALLATGMLSFATFE